MDVVKHVFEMGLSSGETRFAYHGQAVLQALKLVSFREI